MFEIDDDWIDASIKSPRKSGLYWVITGSNLQAKAQWVKHRGKQGYWRDEYGYCLVVSWGGIQAWKPIEEDET